jgi:hypothetical protein
MQQRGYIGAEGRRGNGKCEITIEPAQDCVLYDEFMRCNREEIRAYLTQIGAMVQPAQQYDAGEDLPL